MSDMNAQGINTINNINNLILTPFQVNRELIGCVHFGSLLLLKNLLSDYTLIFPLCHGK